MAFFATAKLLVLLLLCISSHTV